MDRELKDPTRRSSSECYLLQSVRRGTAAVDDMIGRKTLCVSVPDLRENTLNLLGVILGVKERGGDARLPDFGANCFAVGSVVAKANRDIFVLLFD